MDLTKDTSGTTAGARILPRRIVLRAAFTVGMVAGTAGVLAPVFDSDAEAGPRPEAAPGTPPPGGVAAPGTPRGAAAHGAGTPNSAGTGTGGALPRPERFAEMYRGRDIRGTSTAPAPAGAVPAGHVLAAVPHIEVLIDGRPLHIMRRADGTYLSHVNHYESFPTLVETARAAVDELGHSQLSLATTHSM
ncbi:tyrosinase cofactor [Streptomyces sp. NBC_01433]|uniref:tyrosinase family oxidase copper chaperone n=1 Tax=Streptomyces sp. NBC_01433 TaxID=2903864 RepID=UPI0022528654|nr:tyrosinase family oxidase copper chaperone [Streptomyces sp. NBC_01433]MCX4679587.1 tyrosinase cofactor [Streptomyces sp. NBC_01433]